MSFFVVSALINFITSIVFGSFVFLYNRKSRSNQIFAVMSLSIALWSIFYFLWQLSNDYEQSLLLARILTIFSSFIPVLYLHWVVKMVKVKNIFIKIILACGYIMIGFVIAFSFSPLLIKEVAPIMSFAFWPVAGPLYSVYLFFYAFLVFVSIGLLINQIFFSNIENIEKRRFKYVLVGTIIGFGGGMTNFFLWYGIEIPPFGNILVSLYVVILWYAVIKYHFMDIKNFTARLLIIVINIIAFVRILASEDLKDFFFNMTFFLLVAALSAILIKGFEKEIKQKEKLLKLSKELKRANIELKRLDKAKSEFISIASHQLRTPLTAIKGYVSLILEGAYGKNSEETDGALNKIFLANDRLIQLVEDLLNITRIESGRLEYHMEDVQIDGILEELEDMFILRTKEKGLELTIKTLDGKAPFVKADRSKLREVISNLIDNAIKYTKEGFVHVSMEKDTNILRVIIEDSGVGISKESLNSLFAKFSRGTDDTKMYTEGTGLGLYVGKNLVESQGGRIYAESDGLGKGSKFIVEMPIAK